MGIMEENNISFDLIKGFILKEVDRLELKKYVNDIYGLSICREDFASIYSYCPLDHSGYIGISLRYLDKLNSSITDNRSMIVNYLMMLKSIYHEICHALQRKYMDNYRDYRSYLYNRSIDCYDKNYDKYLNNYFYMPNEHEANYYGIYMACSNVVKYLKKYNIDSRELILKYLLSDYKEKFMCSIIESPIIKNEFLFCKEDMDSNLSRIDKIALGLPVTRDEYYHVKNNVINDRLEYDMNKYSLVKKH